MLKRECRESGSLSANAGPEPRTLRQNLTGKQLDFLGDTGNEAGIVLNGKLTQNDKFQRRNEH
jgi:hypothetical protein